jgi:hypothetical protein
MTTELVQITPRQMDRLVKEVDMVLRSHAVPDCFKHNGKIDREAVIQVATFGAALGSPSPVVTWENVDLIRGRTSLRSLAVLGIAQGAWGHRRKVWARWMHSDAEKLTKAILDGYHVDWPEQWRKDMHREVFTMEDAVRAGYVSKNPNYKTMPDTMLQRRCAKNFVKAVCPEVIMGLSDLIGQPIVIDAEVLSFTDDGDIVDAEIVEDVQGDGPKVGETTTVDPWPTAWSSMCRSAGMGADESAALIRFASEGRVSKSADLEPHLRPDAEQALTHVVDGGWHIADGKVVEEAR